MADLAGVEKVNGVRVLALCGESLFIEGIEASLRDRKGIEINLLNTSHPGAAQDIDKFSPEIIIFDLSRNPLSCVMTFLKAHPEVVLIGLDIKSDQALFLSGECRVMPTVGDLMQVIQARGQVENHRQM